MPYSQELGMRVYDPEEGARIGLGIGDAFTQAMQNAQRRRLSERELELAEKQAGLKARQILLRQDGLTQMTQEVAQRSQGLDPNDPQSSLKMRSIRMEALIKAAPKLFADDPDALVRVITAKEAAQPGLEAVRDPITGKPRTVIRHPDGSITALPIDPSEVLTPEEKARRDYDKLMQDKKVFDSLSASNPDRYDIKRLQASANNQLEAWHIQHRSQSDKTPAVIQEYEKGYKLPRAQEIRLQSLESELRSVNKEIETFQKNNVIPIGQEPPREYMILKNRQGRLQREIAGIGKTDEKPKTDETDSNDPLNIRSLLK